MPTLRIEHPVPDFEAWKQAFAQEATAKGVGAAAISGLMATSYASATIAADRGQRSFASLLPHFLYFVEKIDLHKFSQSNIFIDFARTAS